MAEIITHAAFYAGWPNAWAVFNMTKEVYAEEDAQKHMAECLEWENQIQHLASILLEILI